jgi:hypothetical protein
MLPTTRRLASASLGALLLAQAACSDPTTVPDLNNLPDDVLAGGLTANTAQLLTTGLVNRDRLAGGFRYLAFASTLARDVYNIDPSEPRFQQELMGNAVDPAGFIGGGGGTWNEAYNGVRTANTLLEGIGSAADLTEAQRQGVRGIAHTFKALLLYRAWELRGPNGIPVDNSPIEAVGSALRPIACEGNALASISAVLDSGYAELQAAGSAFAVRLPAGFASNGTFDTPAGFARFNRALKARAEVYRGLVGRRAQSFPDALAALDASFLDQAGALTTGVYHVFGAAPDVANPLAVGTVFLNPTIAAPSQHSGLFTNRQGLQAGDRRASKIVFNQSEVSRNGVSTMFGTSLANTAAATQTRPIAIVRNAELVLLRAQALLELGRLQEATAAVNAVRTSDGGLAALPTFTSRDQGVQAVLYEKRFSLLLEGAHRLVDLRAYGLVNAAYLGASQRGTADAFQAALPIPQQERDARSGEAACR